jgi:hypothetical protein
VIDNYAPDNAAKIRELFDRAHEFNPLRNTSPTRDGSRERGRTQFVPNTSTHRKGRLIGFENNDRDYTMDELGEVANSLRRITNEIIRYLRDSGIAPAIAAR